MVLAPCSVRLLIELFERFPILSFPRGKPVCAPAVYNDRRRRWTRKLRILGKDQESVFLDERAIGNELFALGYDVGVTLCRWTLLQDGGGAVEYDEAVRGQLASRLGSLDAAEEYAAGLSFRGGLSDRREYVGAENGKELPNASQKDFHVLAVRFGKLRATRVILLER